MTPLFPNSAIVRVPERFVLRGGSAQRVAVGVRYGLLFHPQHGPVLIDTGYGPRATSAPGRSAVLRLYGAVLRPELVPDQLPLAQLQALGYGADDVQRIVVTHFHPDHIAALRDFPRAQFVTSGAAWQRVRAMRPFTRIRNGIFRELLPDDFEARVLPLETTAPRPLPFGLGSGFDVFGDGTCLAVDLPGHAIGHFGLLWPDLDPPLLYAVDTTWLAAALPDRLPRGPAGLVYADDAAMQQSARLVRRARDAGCRVLLCHDRVS